MQFSYLLDDPTRSEAWPCNDSIIVTINNDSVLWVINKLPIAENQDPLPQSLVDLRNLIISAMMH